MSVSSGCAIRGVKHNTTSEHSKYRARREFERQRAYLVPMHKYVALEMEELESAEGDPGKGAGHATGHVLGPAL